MDKVTTCPHPPTPSEFEELATSISAGPPGMESEAYVTPGSHPIPVCQPVGMGWMQCLGAWALSSWAAILSPPCRILQSRYGG